MYVHAQIRRLKPGFGKLVSGARKDRKLTQFQLATAIGVARETIARVEGGRAPRIEILSALVEELDLELREIAELNDTPPAFVFEGARCDQIFDIGQAIREIRVANKVSLAEVSRSTSISQSTLSRIERGQSPWSRVFIEEPGFETLDRNERPVRVRHDQLSSFIRDGRLEDEDGAG